MIECHQTTIHGTCGLGVEFSFVSAGTSYSFYRNIGTRFGGIGYSVAGFTDTNICRLAYAELKRKTEIVFQSPVKRNRNSGHKFFFIVYKRKGA